RALRVVPVAAMPDGLCGVCVSTAGADYVYIMAGTTPFHREHIALHEIGHLLAGHQGGVGVEDLAGLLLPDLDPALVRAVLGRTSYTSEQEREAEYFATLVLERSLPARRQADAAQPEAVLAEVLGRIEDTWAAPRSGPPGRRPLARHTAASPGKADPFPILTSG
ncbi:hypothetical protein ACFQ07_26000, partial [Actinomadura adrarensis]